MLSGAAISFSHDADFPHGHSGWIAIPVYIFGRQTTKQSLRRHETMNKQSTNSFRLSSISLQSPPAFTSFSKDTVWLVSQALTHSFCSHSFRIGLHSFQRGIRTPPLAKRSPIFFWSFAERCIFPLCSLWLSLSPRETSLLT